MTQYRRTADEAEKVHKYGIDLTIYGRGVPSATVVGVHVERGHFQEFYNIRSSFIYYVVAGHGTFYLNGEAVPVGPADLITAPPCTRIYYFGSMDLVLTVTPAFDEKDERHVRIVSENESPY
jgi:mannose-6-phosphate isomerase-like protein (cupin superfamily)